MLVPILTLSLAGGAHAAAPPATPDAEYDAVCGPAPPADDATDVYLSVATFGALGNDGLDDLAALRAAAAALCDRSNGETRRKTLVFPNGTYDLDGARSFYDTNIADWGVHYDRCADVRIFGCGSTISVVPFDRHWLDAGPPYDGFFYASEYQMLPFILDRAAGLELRGFVLDGNSEEIVQDAIINAEGINTGVMTLACRDYRFADVESHHMLTDGFLIGNDTPDDRDFVFDNVRANHNCRAGLAMIQARLGEILNSTTDRNGDCGASTWDGNVSGTFAGFSPRVGVTFEPDCHIGAEGCELFTTKAGNVVIDNHHAEGNWGFGIASAHSNRVENITVRNSTLISTPPPARGRCSPTSATPCNDDADCPPGPPAEECVFDYCAPDVGQGTAGAGECSDPLWLFDGLAENLSIHASRGRVVLAGGSSQLGDEVTFRNNTVRGGSVLLIAQGTYEGPSRIEVDGNNFFGVYEHGPAERLPLISVADTRSCNTRSWRFAWNYVELPASMRTGDPYEGATTLLGLLAESTNNTFVSFDPVAVLSMTYDDTRVIDDTVTPLDAWAPLGLGGCTDGAGAIVYDEANAPGCEDPGFEACDGIAGEVPGLWFTGPTTLEWWPEYQAGTYRLYRDDLTAVSAGTYGQCLASGIVATTAQDVEVPAPGAGYFYLVTSVSSSGSEGGKGYDSAGAERLGDVCP